MLNIGPLEVFVVVLMPVSGLLAAGYLALALRRTGSAAPADRLHDPG